MVCCSFKVLCSLVKESKGIYIIVIFLGSRVFQGKKSLAWKNRYVMLSGKMVCNRILKECFVLSGLFCFILSCLCLVLSFNEDDWKEFFDTWFNTGTKNKTGPLQFDFSVPDAEDLTGDADSNDNEIQEISGEIRHLRADVGDPYKKTSEKRPSKSSEQRTNYTFNVKEDKEYDFLQRAKQQLLPRLVWLFVCIFPA